ncbi:MAG: ATP-binding protein, partial [Candidatus Zixiibacteriota bacterium]
MFQSPAKEIHAEFPASLQSLDKMRAVARDALGETLLSDRDVTQVCLALEEAASNIIRHAYNGSEGELSLKFVTYRRRVIISLIDHGRPYFPETRDSVSLTRLVETSRKGGLGQMMIDRLMDDVQYIVGSDRNELRMTKLLPRRFAARSPLKGRAFSLRTRFSLATGAIMLAIIAGSYYFMETRIVSGVSERVRANMRSLAGSTASLAAGYVLNERTFVEFDELVYSAASQSEDIQRVTIIDTLGVILADSKDIANIRSPYTPPDGAGDSDGDAETWVDLTDGSFLSVPIMSQGKRLGTVAVEYSDNSFTEEIRRARVAT